MKHDTKPAHGPWRYDGFFVVTIPRENRPNLQISADPADARLISAAPDLLEALRGLMLLLHPDDHAQDTMRPELARARAAIAKAVAR